MTDSRSVRIRRRRSGWLSASSMRRRWWSSSQTRDSRSCSRRRTRWSRQGMTLWSLILCRQEPVKIPLYIEDLGIHIYSSQEICYVIYNNPLLVLEDFIDSRLTEFLRSELRMPFLAGEDRKWMSRGATGEILYLILPGVQLLFPEGAGCHRQTVNGLKETHGGRIQETPCGLFLRS